MKSMKDRDELLNIIREKTLYKSLSNASTFVIVEILGTDRR